MKKLIFSLVALLTGIGATQAQDILVKRNDSADEIQVKVIEIGDEKIRYKRYDNLDGPIYSIARSEVFFIRYENGQKEVITAYDAPQANSADKPVGSANKQAALLARKPLRDRMIEWYIEPKIDAGFVFLKGDSWVGAVPGLNVGGKMFTSRYETSYIGTSIGAEYALYDVGEGDDTMNLWSLTWQLGYGNAGSAQGSSFAWQTGVVANFNLTAQYGDIDMTEAINGFGLGTFLDFGWSWKHSDLSIRLQYTFTNLIKETDSSALRIGLNYCIRF